jgi:cyclophilin family peptidyl-prolyl cis-trans isomerase/phosphoribosylformylglycinamidine (FGAM) synthase PurS component
MNKLLLTLLSVIIVGSVFAESEKAKKPKKPKLEAGMYAKFNTTKGIIICKLEFEKTPMTVANFVGLTEGNFKVDTNNYTRPFYDGVKFHRVIADFMIQGGDPKGNGSGGPNHRIFDETRNDLLHSSAGILSMANSDPQGSKKPFSNTGQTNGSQFFITHKATPHLDGLHTVFGNVIIGQDVVNAIEQNDIMTNVTIIRKGKAAKAFDASKIFEVEAYNRTPNGKIELLKKNKEQISSLKVAIARLEQEQATQKKDKKKQKIASEIANVKERLMVLETQNKTIETAMEEIKKAGAEKIRISKIASMSVEEYNAFLFSEVQKKFPEAKQTSSGLVYVIKEAGAKEPISEGAEVSAHCTGNFRKDGSKFFSTRDGRGEPMKFRYKIDRMVPGWEEGLAMLGEGGKGIFFLPYHLAYGARGRGAAIPAYSDLIFTTDIMSVTPPAQHDENDGHDHSGHDGHKH